MKTGLPYIWHSKASNPFVNLRKEYKARGAALHSVVLRCAALRCAAAVRAAAAAARGVARRGSGCRYC